MNHDTIAQTPTQPSSAPTLRPKLGTVLTTLLVLFLAFDGITKLIRLEPVVKACEEAGIPSELVTGIGLLLLTLTVLYDIPRTAILGAILLTGYLGGGVMVHLLSRKGVFPIVFAMSFGVLVWLGLALREPRLFRWILLRERETGKSPEPADRNVCATRL